MFVADATPRRDAADARASAAATLIFVTPYAAAAAVYYAAAIAMTPTPRRFLPPLSCRCRVSALRRALRRAILRRHAAITLPAAADASVTLCMPLRRPRSLKRTCHS